MHKMHIIKSKGKNDTYMSTLLFSVNWLYWLIWYLTYYILFIITKNILTHIFSTMYGVVKHSHTEKRASRTLF